MKLTARDLSDAAITLSCDVAAIQAICEVEAPKGGFNPDGTPTTLFEGHKFYKYTNGKFKVTAPDLCFPTWTKIHYGKNWQQEQKRLQRAIELDHNAALMSTSWGKFQIMGFNHHLVGFNTVKSFVQAMSQSEREHLLAFVMFVQKTGLAPLLREHDWTGFAHGYNGASYAINAYDTKLAAAYAKYAGKTAEVVTGSIAEAINSTPKAPPTILTFIMAIFKFFATFKKK